MIGKIFNNRYEIKEKLGAGGTALVYMGRDTLLGRLVTIKILREEYANDQQFVTRFRREAQSVASLSHNNIVSVYDVGYEDTYHYIVMEYVEGPNLKEYIKEHGPLPIEKAVDITIQILNALEHAHNHGVIHRDIKSHNILFGKEGVVKVTDFGIAMAIGEMNQNYVDSQGNVVGSVQYMSPEQVQGLPVSEKSDIYSLGIVLYEMLTGRLPYTGITPLEVAMQHVRGEALPPHRLNKDVPMGLSFVVQRAMRKSPDIRYASAYEMKESLLKLGIGSNAVKRGEEAQKQSAQTAVADKKPIKKVNKRLRVLIISLAVLLVLTGIYSLTTVFRVLARGEEVTVPNVTGTTKDAAITALTDAGLGYTLDERPDNTVLKGYVISQSIVGGQVVKKDRVIALVVSEGPQLLRIPDVMGLLQREAEVTLTNNNLTGTFTEEFNDAVPVGRVISQSPTGGTEITAGTTSTVVSVVISKGPAGVIVPNLVGQDLTAARAALKEAGLKEGDIKKQDSDEYYAGYVIWQSVAAQSTIAKDTAIDLTVSTGPGPAAKTAQITYTIPNDGTSHQLRIVVEDSSGTHEEYNQSLAAGTKFNEYITFYGEGKIIVYLDGKQVSTHAVP